jgi:Ca2+-binding RTX toxin-like protein
VPFPAIFELSTINGANGFRINPTTANAATGWSVASAGDINGDGIDDLIVGDPKFSQPGSGYSGAGYVVFGTDAGFAAGLNLADLDGTNGFRISGLAYSYAGVAVASAGDVNGDGFNDLIIGARKDSTDVFYGGATYVVFGSDQPFAADLSLSVINVTNGFRIDGADPSDWSGHSAASAGDFNGDGFGDIIIGAYGADTNGPNSGASYVVFGGAPLPAVLQLGGWLDGTNAFRISGVADNDQSGKTVASAGDLNGDGFDDVVIGAWRAATNGNTGSGASYVVFGTDYSFGANFDLSSLDGTNGFRITGAQAFDSSGYSVASAGDFNGDGFDDIIIGAYAVDENGFGAGASYLVFGSDAGFAADLNLSALNGSNGFRILGLGGGDWSGWSVASAGDVNGDGRDDLIIGAPGASPNGGQSGSSFVVFGRDGPFSADFNLAALNGTDGFRINGPAQFEFVGFSVAAAGDVNGDGVDDLIVGARDAFIGGIRMGAAYVIFGQQTPVPIVLPGTGGDDNHLGGDGADTLSGGGGSDILNGGLGADLLAGGTGDDTYYVDDAGDVTDETGGDGVDTVFATVSWVLSFNVENLTFIALSAIDGTGNSLANTITGNDAANRLDGGDGADRLYGGLGADDLTGGVGGDLLDGGGGADELAGGTGDDTYVVDDAGDTITELAGQGSERVRASVSYTLSANVENLQLTGSAPINGAGNAEANQIDGNSGNNTLSGGGGNDIIRGGAGTDELFGDDGADQLLGGDATDILHGGIGADILQGNDGGDLIYGDGGNDNLDGGAGDDMLQGADGADQLQGGDGVDQLYGGADNDVLRGGAGNDTLRGGTGDDTYVVDDLSDTLIEDIGEGAADTVRASADWTLGANFERLVLEGSGHWNGTGNELANTITGNAGWNYLEGRAGNDTLNGGLGNDLLAGGTGADILIGGGGEDRFIIRQESVFTSSNPQGRSIETDTISDYVIGEDFVDLSVIDANAVGGGVNDAFTIVGAFDGQAGRMTLTFAGGITTVLLDIDGDRAADYRLRINGDVRADTGDWVL